MKKVQGNDAFQRINYLYQISKIMADKNPALSSYYSNLVINVAKKHVLKIHPDVKRQICKRCKCILIDKKTAKMKIKKIKNQKYINWICNICSAKKIFSADKNKDHRVWLEKPESNEEVV